MAEAARGALTASASKGVEALNQNLQERSAALREENQRSEQSDDAAEDSSATDAATEDRSDELSEPETDAAESDEQEVTDPNEGGGR